MIRLVKGKARLNIEIKVSDEKPRIVREVVDIIRIEGIEKESMVTSFDRRVVEEVKNIAPGIKAGFIFKKGNPEFVYEGVWEVLSCSSKVVDRKFVERARQNNKEIHVWTVNKKRDEEISGSRSRWYHHRPPRSFDSISPEKKVIHPTG